jgi:hypothetical protein
VNISRIPLLGVYAACVLLAETARADAVSELASLSVFKNVDLAQLSAAGAKTERGPKLATGRFLSVQTIYTVPRSPEQEAETLRSWNPARHPELRVLQHVPVSGSPSPEDFARIRNLANTGPTGALLSASQRLATSLQLSNEEAQRLSAVAGGGQAGIENFWMDLLARRTRAFASGGSAAQAPYEHGGQNVRPSQELNGLLQSQDKVRAQFAGLLNSSGVGRGGGGMKPFLYWEFLNVEDSGVLTLGASYGRAGSSGSYQAADTLYYASGGYYVTLTLWQMWPVNIGGKPSTLVWRGDMVSSASLAGLRGIERLGSESSMIKNINRSVNLYRRDTLNR